MSSSLNVWRMKPWCETRIDLSSLFDTFSWPLDVFVFSRRMDRCRSLMLNTNVFDGSSASSSSRFSRIQSLLDSQRRFPFLWKPPSNINDHVRSWHPFLLSLDCFAHQESLELELLFPEKLFRVVPKALRIFRFESEAKLLPLSSLNRSQFMMNVLVQRIKRRPMLFWSSRSIETKNSASLLDEVHQIGR